MIAPAAGFRLLPQGGGLALLPLGAAGLAVDTLMTGRPLAQVERLLPAVFGLCRPVQECALALALGRPLPDLAALRRDILRDHLAKLCLHLPRALGIPAFALPPNWPAGGADLRMALFGAQELPAPGAFAAWLGAGGGLAPLCARLAETFAPGEGRTDLPLFDTRAPFAPDPVDNSLFTRNGAHPLVAYVAARYGRGPLALVLARLADVDALSRGHLPAPERLADGTALVPCSRGLCALRLAAPGGVVAQFARRTPTDHLLMPGGLLARALAHLPPAKAALAPLLAEILDPCIPVTLEASDA